MNPFYCYIFTFSIALAVYALNWSTLYPKLTLPLFLFLMLTIGAHALAGHFWKNLSSGWKQIKLSEDRNPMLVTAFIYILWTLDFIYEGGVPLFKILIGSPYNYRLFGVPSLHVFTVTFASFYTVYLFHLYLSTRNGLVFVFYFINLAAALLIYSRAMLIFNISSSLLLYILTMKIIPIRFYFLTAAGLLLFFFFFGIMGTLRVSRESKKPYDNQLFLETGGATPQFRDSGIPGEFFWAYIYLSSPIANLQENIISTEPQTVTFQRFAEMFNSELLPDFISKRTNHIFNLTTVKEFRIPGPFNVTTLFSRAFSYLDWLGVVIMALSSLLLPWIYLKVVPGDSRYFLTGIAILCVMWGFMCYDNTIRFTGLSLQLGYPILFTWLNKFKIFNLFRG